MEICYRKAGVEDAGQVSRIHAASWRKAYEGLIPQVYLDQLSDDHWTEAFTQWIENGSLKVWLACAGELPIGAVACGSAREGEFQGWGEIVSLYVLPEYWGCGAGRGLLARALQELIGLGLPYVYLWVMEGNRRARIFYEKCGLLCNGDSCVCEIEGTEVKDVRYIVSLRKLQCGETALVSTFG